MTPERFQTIEEIFLAAVEQEPEQVGAFLDTACESDEALRREVEALLASDQGAGQFMERSNLGLATKIIENRQAKLLAGQTIGHYKISEPIGAGGMGEVYLASDVTAGRKAVLKLLPLRFTGDSERLKRFEQEAHAVVALNHPNILTVYEIGEDHLIHYIASELIEGETLRDRLAHGSIQLTEAVDVAIQVARALAAAHHAGIVHRDIKPENIMLRPDGFAKVLDFGIAKLAEQELPVTMPRDEALSLVETNLGAVVGTVRYMSPEQARGAHVDKTTDIWSLGVVLYEMLTGHAPFTGDIPKEVMSSILEKEPPPLTRYIAHAPAELQQIVSKTLRKDRTQRYRGAYELLQALKDLRWKLEVELERAAAPLWLRGARSPAALLLVSTIAALALAIPFYRHRNIATSLPPEKSIAVLPFENLSDAKFENLGERNEATLFADGVQDDILTKLAKVAELKVISRTSVMRYRGPHNVQEIGLALNVSHVLEGSVRSTAGRIHLNAQLIDTRSDTHIWAEEYDRNLDEMFAIQSEIAQKVADRLHAKLSLAEERSIHQPPTTNVAAFDLYTHARNLFLAASFSNNGKVELLQAADLLDQAIARDLSFFQAYCQLVWIHDLLYNLGHDHTPARLALAEAAIQAAFRIHPDAGEAHLSRGDNLFRAYLDYDDALAEVEVARHTLPNDPRSFELKGYIERRQGKHEEALRSFERAVDLDPRNVFMLQQIAGSYLYLRRYAEEESAYDRALAIDPNDVETKAGRTRTELDWKAETQPLHQLVSSLRAANPAALRQIADSWVICALAERDPIAINDALIAAGENTPLNEEAVHFNRPFVEGLIARLENDEGKARSAFQAARTEQEQSVRTQPNYAPPLCVLGVIDAALGRKEDALREGRRAVELLPVEKDSINGALMIEYLAMTAAWVGEKDLACEELAIAIKYPSPLSYGNLKLLPQWDPLQGDPRFEKIVASLAPK